jgi:hypothetical protein
VHTTGRVALHIGAVTLIHRFGSSLNAHVHFHVCAVDEMFEEVAVEGDVQSSPQGNAVPPMPETAKPKRSKAHCLWLVLIARI